MDESSRKLESLVESQRDRIHRLEDLVSRLTHRDHSGFSRAGTLVTAEVKNTGSTEAIDIEGSTTTSDSEKTVVRRKPTC
jgi:hypothetical protein